MKQNIPFLKGEKINLCPLNEELHLDNTLQWLNDEDVIKWLLMIFPLSETQEKDWFAKRLILSNPPSDILLAIVLKDGKHVGNIGLHKIDWISRRAELGIVIGDKEQWGKGLATEAESLLIDFAWKKLNLCKITAHVFSDNIASLKALQKNGAVEEARLKDHIWKNGKFNDLIALAIFNNQESPK
ncbi:MAG: Spermidine N(1)-acetyltransferase [Parcubacteria group bacterium ADurb.Bin316]|nr:MAG: Spermidine N(1)-acetyltransferase [Parcubacteria group bacterium ADurb.Bin316]HOZ55675.1 GNAT family N-acetyltransferase [bacterium]